MNTSVYQFTVKLVVKLPEGSVSFIKVLYAKVTGLLRPRCLAHDYVVKMLDESHTSGV
jgi:hypothetical protein